jgi:uncharacterized cupredoxin-like copper-binding protein
LAGAWERLKFQHLSHPNSTAIWIDTFIKEFNTPMDNTMNPKDTYMTSKILILLIFLYPISIQAAEGDQPDASGMGKHAMQDHQNHQPQSQAGMPMPASSANKTLTVSLTDAMKIVFGAPLDIHQDDIVRFVVTNEGKERHEFSISSLAERKAHVEMMRKMPGMKHNNDHTVTLEPGETSELIWHFSGESRVIFACNMPGHSEAGMLQMAMLKPRQDTSGPAMSDGNHE